MKSEKTAVIGGSFNPIHNGHLYLAQQILNAENYERLIFVPLNRPSHKHEGEGVRISAKHRIAMLELAVESLNLQGKEVIIERCEIERGGYSYSFETVIYLYQMYSISGLLGFVIGDDLAPDLASWYKWEQLREIVMFIIARREQTAPENIIVPEGCLYTVLDNPIMEVSSSLIREKLGSGEKTGDLMPDAVYAYIKRNRLYYS
ncbi:MAG: nicotinate (nicotinamide) nucleotide adenylyltransferase [Spirochaetia bacterium]|nr:nicotinate (nicotinamide) nucleotide adenylyltransferase [Spirochaetia bacterium]